MSAKTKNSNLADQLSKFRSTILAQEKAKAQAHVQSFSSPTPVTIEEKPVPTPSFTPPPAKSQPPEKKKEESRTGTFKVSLRPVHETKSAKKTSLTIQISSYSLEKLKHHSQGNIWTVDELVEELAQQHLHKAYPTITFRGTKLADEGNYRIFDRHKHHPALYLKSNRGEFIIRTRKENSEYVRWFELYQKRAEPDAHEKACEMCTFSLQQELEKFTRPNTPNLIYPEDFNVDQVI